MGPLFCTTWHCIFSYIIMMIRQWNRKSTQRDFHELEDDTDNIKTGRLQDDSFSSSCSSSSNDESRDDDGASTPILPNSVFTKFFNLSIPILSRSHTRSRVTATSIPTEHTRSSTCYDDDSAQQEWTNVPPFAVVSPEYHKATVQVPTHFSLPGIIQEQLLQQPQQVRLPSHPITGLETSQTINRVEEEELLHPSARHRRRRSHYRTPSPHPRPTTRTLVNHLHQTPPFNPGYCSTIVPGTPETLVVQIANTSPSQLLPDFCPSPEEQRFSFVSSSFDRQDLSFAPPPAPLKVSPESVRSRHSNPPYIPPVPHTPLEPSNQGNSTPVNAVLISPTTEPINNSTCDKLSLEHPATLHSATSSAVHQRDDTACNPPPLQVFTKTMMQQQQQQLPNLGRNNNNSNNHDDISSLGADSWGESPTRIFDNHLQQQEAQEQLKTASQQTMETTALPSTAMGADTSPRAPIWCCCLWFRRVPYVMRIAIFVGMALWFAAVALVALAVILGKNHNNRQAGSTSLNSNPTGSEIWTSLPPATTPTVDDGIVLAPSVAPMANDSKHTSSPVPDPPRQPSPSPVVPKLPNSGNQSGVKTTTTAVPSLVPSTTRLTMAPSPFPSSTTTLFPTFAPKADEPKKMGMRRTRRNLHKIIPPNVN